MTTVIGHRSSGGDIRDACVSSGRRRSCAVSRRTQACVDLPLVVGHRSGWRVHASPSKTTTIRMFGLRPYQWRFPHLYVSILLRDTVRVDWPCMGDLSHSERVCVIRADGLRMFDAECLHRSLCRPMWPSAVTQLPCTPDPRHSAGCVRHARRGSAAVTYLALSLALLSAGTGPPSASVIAMCLGDRHR